MSALLTPEVLRRIQAEVEAWINANLTPEQLQSKEYKEYIESLIRYRLREPLSPAPGKTPVLGGVGVAERTRPDVETEDPCEEEVLNGLFKTASTIQPINEFGLYRQIYPRNENGTYGPWEDSRQMARSFEGGGAGWCHIFMPADQAGSLSGSMATKFSGEMRRIVQMIHGTGYPCLYSHCWEKTHGIFIASGGEYWVIEIDHTEGVKAWPIPKCQELTAVEQAEYGLPFDFIPSPTWGTLEKTELLAASEMSELGGKSAFFPESGWAFNYTGDEAQNVFIGQAGAWKKSHRFKIEIFEAVVDGVSQPTSATLAVVESRYLWRPGPSGPQYPRYIAEGPVLQTEDLHYDQDEPPPIVEDAPLFVCFLDGKSEPVVIYNTRTIEESDEEDETDIDNNMLLACSRFPNTASESLPVSYTEVSGESREIYLPVYGYKATGLALPKSIESSWSITAERGISVTWTMPAGWHFRPNNSRVYEQNWVGHKDAWVGGTETRNSGHGLVIPFNDRQQVYFYNNTLHSIVAETIKKNSTQGFSMGFYYSNAINCDVDSPYNALCGCSEANNNKHVDGAPYPSLPTPSYQATLFYQPQSGIELSDPVPFAIDEYWGSGYLFCAPNGCNGPPALLTCPGVFEETIFDGGVYNYTQALYAINPITGVWEKLWDNDEDYTSNPYTKFVTGVDDAQYMTSIIDAFLNEGMINKEMSNFTAGEMHYFGTSLKASYPIETVDASLYMGWFGVPKK